MLAAESGWQLWWFSKARLGRPVSGAQDHHPRLAAPKPLAAGRVLQGGEFDEAGEDDHGWRVGLIVKLGTGSGLSLVSALAQFSMSVDTLHHAIRGGCGENCQVRGARPAS
jgi:hypothetical protein